MKKPGRYILFALVAMALLLADPQAFARKRKIKTTVKITENNKSEIYRNDAFGTSYRNLPDSAALREGIILYGFDKPLNSNKERFFITNNNNRKLTGIDLEIRYLQHPAKTELHRVRKFFTSEIPPNESRQIVYKSFDPQDTFVYFKSFTDKTRTTKNFMLFDVEIIVKDLYFEAEEEELVGPPAQCKK